MEDLHLSVSFYPDNSFVCDTVCSANLQTHIRYNDTFRPGRIMFIDGEYVCGGMLKEPYMSERVKELKDYITTLGIKPKSYDTAPYS